MANVIKSNITSGLLASLSEYYNELEDYEMIGNAKKRKEITNPNPNTVKISNNSGVDMYICRMEHIKTIDLESVSFEDDSRFHLLKCGKSIIMTSNPQRIESNAKVALLLSSSSVDLLGVRKPIFNAPLNCNNAEEQTTLVLCPEKPICHKKYAFEPVVEWCMQNQRLRQAYHNTSALEQGMDLLSNQIWSPSNRAFTREKEGCWLHPYLDTDVCEWTDMTGVLRMEKDRVTLPDNKWIWANDWTIDLPGNYGKSSDADGWEYGKDFKSFREKDRYFQVGDICRRRRWTRTRLIKPPQIEDPSRPLSIAWTRSKSSNDEILVNITSPFTVYNNTNLELSVLGCSPSWRHDHLLGLVNAEEKLSIPLHLSCFTHVRLGIDDLKRKHSKDSLPDSSFSCSDHILIIPKSAESQSIFPASIVLDYEKSIRSNLPCILHFLVKLTCSSGCTTITIDPIVRVINLLPCPLQFRLFEDDNSDYVDELSLDDRILDEQSLDSETENSSIAVDSMSSPCVSFRVPGYRWSIQQRIINRKLALLTWRPEVQDQLNRLELSDSNDNGDSYTTVIHFDRLTYGGDPLEVVMETVPGDTPLLRIFAQYWIIDKTGFGLRYCDGFGDLLGSTLKTTRPRRSYLLNKEKQNEAFLEDMNVDGHEWTIGMNGMTFYFSREAKLAISIDCGDLESSNESIRRINSNWSKLIDISNIMPKAVFSVTEIQGERQFDLSYDVAFGPSSFSRTKVVTIYNRFKLVNLSDCPIYVSQHNLGMISTIVPPNSSVPYHWETKAPGNKVQLSLDNKHWTPGSIQLDNVGMSALRLPNDSIIPTVVQAEVRLAKKNYDCAVTILLWKTDGNQNPLYKIENKSSYTILCNQSHDEQPLGDQVFTPPACNGISSNQAETCAPKTTFDILSEGLNCGLIDSNHNRSDSSHYVWKINKGAVLCFGLDNPNRSRALEWTCEELQHENSSHKPNIDMDALGLTSEQVLSSGNKIGCIVRANHCTKVIEFFDFAYDNDKQHPVVADLKDKLIHHKASLSLQDLSLEKTSQDEGDHVAFSVKINIAGLYGSIVENSMNNVAGREIFLVAIDKANLTISQTRGSHQEFEFKMLSMQIDNHIKNATHPVLVSGILVSVRHLFFAASKLCFN